MGMGQEDRGMGWIKFELLISVIVKNNVPKIDIYFKIGEGIKYFGIVICRHCHC
jgi:hypothetical protein